MRNVYCGKDRTEEIAFYRDFAENTLRPYVPEMEEQGGTPQELLDIMFEKGLFGVPFPKEYRGQGKDYVSAAILMDELSRITPATPGIVNVSDEIVGSALQKHGTPAQKEKYLTMLATGHVGAFALTEPGAGSDAGGVKTVAVKKGDKWILNGNKCFITNSEIADVFLIAALTEIGGGKKKISMFIVEKDFPGFAIGAHEDKMGIRSSSTCELILTDCEVPEENLLGVLGKGLGIALGGLDGGRVMIAAQGLGIAQGCWDEAVEYLKSHVEETGGAINSQAVQFELAHLAMRIEAARLMVYQAAELWSEGQAFGTEAAMAKYFATDIANEAARICIQLMGYEGASLGNRVEQLFRDAKITEIYEGTNEIQLMVIAGKLGIKA